MPRTFPPAPAWLANGHRIKAPLDYSRGPEKTWVYGALRVRDGKELTRCAASRNSTNYIALLADIEADNPTGDIFIITDNLSSHNSAQTRTWLAEHPRLHQVFIPKGACWLNLQEGWLGSVGGSSAAMLSPGRALPTLMRLSRLLASRPLNSTGEPTLGSGGALPRITATTADSFLIVFKERSSRGCTKRLLRPIAIDELLRPIRRFQQQAT